MELQWNNYQYTTQVIVSVAVGILTVVSVWVFIQRSSESLSYHFKKESKGLSNSSSSMSALPVQLYIPNLLGYARIVLAFVGLSNAFSNPTRCTIIWTISASLDLFDGLLARWLNQCSSFGVLLDIAADIVLRSSFWIAALMTSVHLSITTTSSRVSSSPSLISDPSTIAMISCFVISLEWATMLCTQLHSKAGEDDGGHWKACRQNDPTFIQSIFANNFRSPLGVICIYGLFASGYVVYARNYPVLVDHIPFFDWLFYLAIIGRSITMIAEIWLCSGYLSMIIAQDSDPQHRTKKRKNTQMSTPTMTANPPET